MLLKFPVNEAIKVWLQKRVSRRLTRNICYITLYTVLLHSATVVRTAFAHTASEHTQSLHYKDSTPLFCYQVKSKLYSNNISRTGRGRRGVFRVLNNEKKEEKICLLFFLHAGTPDVTKHHPTLQFPSGLLGFLCLSAQNFGFQQHNYFGSVSPLSSASSDTADIYFQWYSSENQLYATCHTPISRQEKIVTLNWYA